MAEPVARWQPPQPEPGELERALGPLCALGRAVIDAIDAYPTAPNYIAPDHPGVVQLTAAFVRHRDQVLQADDPVPYQWQFGRFVRRAVDQSNLAAMCKLFDLFDRAMYSSPIRIATICLHISLHPIQADAVRLFKAVVDAMSAGAFQHWSSFVYDLVSFALQTKWGPTRLVRGVTRPVRWSEWIHEQEFTAKVEKSLSVGSPFPLEFAYIVGIIPCGIPFSLLRILVHAFIRSNPNASARTTAAALLQEAEVSLAFGSGAHDFDEEVHRGLVQHLEHLLEVRLPVNGAVLEPAQTDMIQQLARHLAHSQIGDARVIPEIMDYVRHVPVRDTTPRAYREHEFQAARSAIGSVQIARANANVAAAASSSSAPAPSRPRTDDAAGASDAKRRA